MGTVDADWLPVVVFSHEKEAAMRVLMGVLRVGAVVLLGASAWFGFVAGVRRWVPCRGSFRSSFESHECLVAQSHETAYLPELGVPEGVSLLLLGGALLLLALLGTMPWGWRLAALTVGPVHALLGVYELRTVGNTDPPLGPAPAPTLADGLFALAVFAAPLVMVAVGVVLVVRSAQQPNSPWRRPDLPLALAWLAMVVGWPITEFFLLSFAYSSHDAPPGTGLLRSVMVALAAGLVVWHTVSSAAYRANPQAASATSPEPSRSPAATSEA